MKNPSFFKFLIQYLSGFDIFISYRWKDSQPYVKALAAELEKKGFTCFIDVKGMTKGDLITEALKRAIRKSTMFVLIVTENVPNSEWIPQELEIFPALKRKIIPISVDDSINSLDLNKSPWIVLKNRDTIQETKDNVVAGAPAEHVVVEIDRAFTFKRQEAVAAGKVFRLSLAVAAVVLLITVFAIYQTIEAKQQQEIAGRMTGVAEEKTRDATVQKARADEQTSIAEEKTREANLQKGRADKQTAIAEEKTSEATAQRARAEEQTARAIKEAGKARNEQELAMTTQDALRLYESARYERDETVGTERAIERYKDTLPILRRIGDTQREANMLVNIGKLYASLGNPKRSGEEPTAEEKARSEQAAAGYYEQAYALYGRSADRGSELFEESHALGVLGNFYEEKDPMRALKYKSGLLQILIKNRQIEKSYSERRQVLTVSHEVAVLYYKLGMKREAVQHFTRAISFHAKVLNDDDDGNVRAVVLWELETLGNIQNELNDKQASLKSFLQALEYYDKETEYDEKSPPLFKSTDDFDKAKTLMVIARLYSDLNDDRKALEYFDKALAAYLRANKGDAPFPPFTFVTGWDGYRKAPEALKQLGAIYQKTNNSQKAIEAYSESLKIYRGFENKAEEANLLNILGTIYQSLGEQQKAAEFFREAQKVKSK